jgi:DNA repair exonuclease SbcCD nuclease subunit
MSFSLLAIGDVHLDAPSLLGGDERKKAEALKKEAFKKAADEAVARNVSAFLICGDLYDESSVSFETLIFLRKNFLKLASCNIKILYAHGGSDPGPAPDLIKTGNLVDFSHEVERYELTSAEAIPEAVVYATGFSNNTGLLIDQLETKNTGYPTIGMMYVSGGFSEQGSFMLDSLVNMNYDLFVLGGYHHYLVARDEGNIIFAGSPTGTWFGDKAGGALYAELNEDGKMVLDKIPLSQAMWHDIEISNMTETDIGTLRRKIETEIQSAVTSTKDAFVRVRLTGRCLLAESLTDEVIAEMESDLSGTLDLAVFIQKENLQSIIPKTLFDSTSPLVESVKIIDLLKNDGEKFEQLVEVLQKKHELFYSTIPEEKKKKYGADFKKGLLDAVCKVMVKEAGYEN